MQMLIVETRQTDGNDFREHVGYPDSSTELSSGNMLQVVQQFLQSIIVCIMLFAYII